MPLVTRVWIRTGLVSLVLSLLLLLLHAVGEVFPAARPPIPWATVFHLLTVGWLTNLIFGVAWWLFPPVSREAGRGGEGPAWSAYSFLNAGLLMRVVGEPLSAGADARGAAAVLILSAAFQFSGACIMAALLWRRTHPAQSK